MASIDYPYGELMYPPWYTRIHKSTNKFERPQERFFVGEQEGNPHPVLIKMFTCDSAPLNRAGKARTKVSNKVRALRAWYDKCESLGLKGLRNTREWWICACKKTRCQDGPP